MHIILHALFLQCIVIIDINYQQARRPDLAAGEDKNQKKEPKTRRGGAHFKNTVLDACSNQGANLEMGETDFKWWSGHHCLPRWRRP